MTYIRILKELPTQFTREQLLKKTLSFGYTISLADKVTERAVHSGMVERTERGRFRKLSEEIMSL